MFCTKCGSKLGDGYKFCARCGTPVEPIDSDVTTKPVTDAMPPDHDALAKTPVIDGGNDETPEMTDTDIADAVSDAIAEETTPTSLEIPNEESDHEIATTIPAPPVTQLADATDGQSSPTAEPPFSQPQQMTATPPYDGTYGTGSGYGYSMSQSTGNGMGASNGTPAQIPSQKVPWYMTVPGRIAMGAVGLVLIISGIAKMVGACTPSGGESNPPIERTDTPKKPADDMDAPSDDKEKKDDKTGTDGDEDKDIIIADDDDIIVADDDDVIIRNESGDSDDVSYGSGEKFDSWAEECIDADGNPTVYAISELKGWQLETLCQEKGLKWNDQQREWDGKNGYALVVYDKNHQRIDDEDIAKLGKAADNDNVVYEIQSEGHNEVEDAYKEFVEAIMVSEDSEVMTDKMLVGVAYGPSMSRLLVPVYKGSVVPYSMTQVFSEKAIKAGVYDKFNDPSQAYPERDTYGDTVPKVFESVTGRKVGSNH